MKKPARTYVIEEDEHLDNLRKIIKRDFFSNSSQSNKSSEGTIELSLNSYLSNFKSNENQFFAAMVKNNDEQWKQQHWWLGKQDKMLMIMQEEQKQKLSLTYHNMMETNIEANGIDVTITRQEAKNSIFFPKDTKASLQSEEYQTSKKVVYANCQLEEQHQFDQQHRHQQHHHYRRGKLDSYDDELYLPETPLLEGSQKNGEAYSEYQAVGGNRYQTLRQPSPEPQKAPLITWGNIQTTPLRISGPEFKIPETPQRQMILSSLNQGINKSKIESSSKKNEHIMKMLGSITPSHRNSRSRISSVRVEEKSLRRSKQVGKDASLGKEGELRGLLNLQKK